MCWSVLVVSARLDLMSAGPSNPSLPQSQPPGSPSDRPTPTGDELLYAPWRLAYIESLEDDETSTTPASASTSQATPAASSSSPVGGCFLGEYWRSPERDAQNHVLVRTDRGMILLNGYPYAGGHLLVALGEARGRLLEYDAADRRALWCLVDAACALMEFVLRPQGVNIGINQGRAAGAGVPQHLHVHLVPRWGGDVNFMTTVGRVRVIPASLEMMANRYRAGWSRIGGDWLPVLAGSC